MWRAGPLGLLIVIHGPDGQIQTAKAGRRDLAKVFTPLHSRTQNASPLPYPPRMGIVTSTLSDTTCDKSCAAILDFERGSMILFLDSQGRAEFAAAWFGPADLSTTRSGRSSTDIVPMGDAPCTGSNRTSCTDWQISSDGRIVIVIEYDAFGNPIGYEIYEDGRLISIGGNREER